MELEVLPAIGLEAALSSGKLILTPNKRLARYYSRVLFARQLQGRESAWQQIALPAAPVDTLTQWSRKQFASLVMLEDVSASLSVPDQALLARMPVSGLQEDLIWEQVITADEQNPLLNRRAITRLVKEAYQCQIEWELEINELDPDLEWQQYLQWRHRFEARCSELSVVDDARFRKLVMRVLAASSRWQLPDSIVLAGFLECSPSDQAILTAVQRRGCQLLRVEFAQRQTPVSLRRASDPDQELRLAASWAAEQVNQGANAVAVVVNALEQCRVQVASVFDELLAEHIDSKQGGRVERIRSFNLSLGRPLSDYPLVGAAFCILQLYQAVAAHRALGFELISRLLLNPFLPGAAVELQTRALLEADIRRQRYHELKLAELGRIATAFSVRSGQSLQGFLAMLAAIEALVEQRQLTSKGGRAKASPGWEKVLLDVLFAAGWPGELLLSAAEEKNLNAFLQQLAELDANLRFQSQPRASLEQALGLLERQCRECVHQDQAGDNAPIQVLGPLEALGQPVDALWLLNMNAANWPMPPRTNPFIPALYQRNIPHASAARELDYTLGLQRALLAQASEVQASFAQFDGDAENQPSPLLWDQSLDLPAPETEVAPQALRLSLQQKIYASYTIPANIFAHPLLSAHDDLYGEPLSPAQREHLRGGTALFRAQALCPMAAYLQYRLGAEVLEQPSRDLDPRDRGSLVHKALELLWQKLQSQQALLDLTEQQLQAEIHHSVAAALDSLGSALSALPRLSRRLEAERCELLLREWMVQEQQREPFRILALEAERRFELQGFSIRAMIDRIDLLADGRLLIVDYKTSDIKTAHLEAWQHPRLLDPQLPCYVINEETLQSNAVQGACFARLRPGNTGWVGLVQNRDGVSTDARAFIAMEAGSEQSGRWLQLKSQWRDALLNLAEEISSGFCALIVFDEEQLTYNDYRPVLRLAELRLQQQSTAQQACQPGETD